jgi:hypothetical protein
MRFLLMIAILCVPALGQSQQAIARKDGAKHAAEFQDAIEVNIRPELRAKLAPIVAAIRYAENGKTYQYGILHPRCPRTYRGQAGWCAATVQKNYDRWVKAGRKGAFLVYLGAVYCPIGADNDPTGLNKHWIKNVTYYTKKFTKKG